MSSHSIQTPAKLNLRLKVTGKRPDGYHELVSVMVPIDLYDLMVFTVISEKIELSCSGYDVPVDESNLVYRAAEAFFSKAGIEKGIAIDLEKRIPVAAGMGGGSSDAAATLLTLNEIWSRPLSDRELHGLGVGLGADVPFFLLCKPSLASGIGDVLEPLENIPECWYVIVKPPIAVSTAWVYGNLKLRLTSGEYDYIKKHLKKGLSSISPILENDLEKVTSANYPIIETIKKGLLNAGAEGALMTGSGPTVFGVFPTLNQARSAQKNIVSLKVGDVFVATNWEGP